MNKIIGLLCPLLIITVNSVEIHLLRKTLNKQFYEKFSLSMSVCDLVRGFMCLTAVSYISIVQVEFYVDLYWIIWRFSLCYCSLTTPLHLINNRSLPSSSVFNPEEAGYLGGTIVVSSQDFVTANIVIFLARGVELKMCYVYMKQLIYATFAEIVIIVNIVLLSFYYAIICIINKKK